MYSKKRILLVLALIMSVLTVNAQEAEKKKSPFSGSVELTTKYLWRGQEYGEAPTFFPTLSFSTGGLCIYGTGAYTFDNSWREADLGISYTLGDFTLGVVDYYYPTMVGEKDSFFNYKNKETGHAFEGALTYAPSSLPITAFISTFFYGADKNADGDQAWSTYAELGYHYDFSETNIISVALGASLNKSLYNNYETGFSVVNIAVKYQTEIYAAKRFSIPASVQYMVNPQKEKNYISFSLGLSF